MAKQMKKYMAVTTASFMAVQLAACGNSETQIVEEYPTTTSTTNPLSEEQTQATNEKLGVFNILYETSFNPTAAPKTMPIKTSLQSFDSSDKTIPKIAPPDTPIHVQIV